MAADEPWRDLMQPRGVVDKTEVLARLRVAEVVPVADRFRRVSGEQRGEIALGQSPDGHALEFVHRGSYESLDDTYEAITNYLDDKQLESQDVLIEQYATDPAKSDANNLVINVLVLTK